MLGVIALIGIFVAWASYDAYKHLYKTHKLWRYIQADDSLKHPRAMYHDYKSEEVSE